MPYLNKIALIGHVGRDPETPSSKNPDFVKFSFGVTKTWKNDAGEKQSRTEWYEIMTSQKGKSSTIQKYIRKGDLLYIEGEPSCNAYISKKEGEVGEAKANIKVEITNLVMLGSKQDKEQQPVQQHETVGTQKYASTTPPAKRHDLDDDIPF